MPISSFIEDYLQKQQDTIEKLPHSKIKELVELYQKAWREDRQIFVCGNGGSASNASHFITDLSKGASDVLKKRFRGMSLNDNVSWMTALGTAAERGSQGSAANRIAGGVNHGQPPVAHAP